ncbi:MAG TPA: alpha/beta hydrolase-fold protein [Gemmatimonadaceae bacterium]|nr:alpha/beta hydrolase-fold protein [Gemmatimonadaceae bacterium]
MKFARAAVIVVLCPLLAKGQQPASANDRTTSLSSRVLGESRTIDISLPRDYASTTERYPVIVVLDGEFEHNIAASIARFYASTGMMPKAIAVGVRNTHRTLDMTPPAVMGFTPPPEVEQSGGAKKFLTFLGDELLPYLDKTYRTAPMRVLVGHSLGGLFALHALALRPGLFTGYVVMEPALWWNNERDFNDARAAMGRADATHTRLMLVNTRSMHLDTTQWGGSKPMIREIEVTGETHESMAAAGILAGFRTLFADFRPSTWKPGTRPIAMLLRYDSVAARVGYRVPISANAYEQAIRMSTLARDFDDADRMLQRMRESLGETALVRQLRDFVTEERATPAPEGLIPLVIPARRPTPADAARFLGRWENVGGDQPHEIVVRASGDTIVVHDRILFPSGQLDEGDHQVIQITPNGVLEWGLPWFRGIAALLVLKGEIQSDGTMRVTREPRGWVPRGPGGDDMHRTEVLRRAPTG